MNDVLFEPVAQRFGPCAQNETTFQFLERGGRPEAVDIRQWMEKWFREFPDNREGKKNELKSKLKSKSFKQFMGAYFELQVFAILKRIGCAVHVEPSFRNTSGTVDFSAVGGEDIFYVESTVCGIGQGILISNNLEEDAVRKIKKDLIDPHSDLILFATGELRKTLRRDNVAAPFRNLLDKYSADDVKQYHSKFGYGYATELLSAEVREGDWVLEGYLAPPASSDDKGRIVGLGIGGAMDGSTPLAAALSRKAVDWKKKKLEDEMFLVAVNVCHSEYSLGDEVEAIFGRSDATGERGEFLRKLHRISGVLVFGNATLGNERCAPVKLYRNGGKRIPDCLRFLLQEQCFGKLLGIR